MKFKTTKKEIKKGYYYVFQCGYCDLQNLFHGKSAEAYTCGVYGWNFDLYDIDGVAITTGYRSMMGKQISRDLIEKYENKAKKAIERGNFNYKKTQTALEKLRIAFVNELLEDLKK
jgi:biotin carboxylase